MHNDSLFFQAFIYLAAAVIAVPIAKRLGLGSVLGYLIAGIIIGPFALQLVGEEGQDVMHFAEFGVVMMLFLIGLELQPSLLWKLRGPILGVGGLQVGITALVILLVGIIAGLGWKVSLAVGLTLALSSTAIVLQTLKEKGLTKTVGGQYTFSVLLFQDIAVIPILAFLPLLAVPGLVGAPAAVGAHEATTWLEGLPIWGQTGVVFGAIAAIIISGKFILNPLFRFIAKTRVREIFTAAGLLLIIGIALLMTWVGLSPALGTFLAGVVLAQSEFRHELESNIEPFKGLLLGVFFIAVGASIDFELIASDPWLILGLVASLIIIKLVVLLGIGKAFGLGMDNKVLFAFALAQGGEFAFVLFSFALQNNVLTTDVTSPLIAAVAVSMGLTPLLMLINEKLIQPRFGTLEKIERKDDEIDKSNKVIIAGFGRMGSVIGRFLRANGIEATFLDIDADNVELLRKIGLNVFYGDASRTDLLEAAGAAEARLLIVAIDEPEKTLRIVESAHKNFPDLKIMARAAGWWDSYDLLDAGVKDIYPETFDSALKLGVDALGLLGIRPNQAVRFSNIFRKHEERHLRELAEIRHDKKEHIKGVRQRIFDLERIMKEELELSWKDKDLGWDTTSMIEEFNKIREQTDNQD